MKNVLLSFLVIAIILTSCKNYDDEFDALNTSIASLQSQISSIATLQSSLTTIQNSVTSLQTTLEGTNSDLSTVLINITSIQADLDALISDFSDAGLATIQETLAALQADVNELLESHNVTDLILNLTGLDELGTDFVYEGWIIVNGSPVSTGTFSSVTFPQSFTVDIDALAAATKFILSIEPTIDADPTPAATKILVGDFVGNTASVSTAIVGDYSNAAGKYILATPTNGMATNENSGIWFLDLPNSMPPPLAGLTLPELPNGWKYEGWAVINGTPVTTGTFTNVNATDEFNGFSGPDALGAPNGADGFFPGEDFLFNAPDGLTFPTDLSGGKAVISIEPDPDNSLMPFTLKPLVGDIPNPATDHVTYNMMQNLGSFPGGSVSR